MWQKAKELYAAGQFSEALAEFLKDPENNAAYDHNIGTTYLQLKKPELALAYLERAKHQKPYDSDISQQLKIAREQVYASRAETEVDPSSTWYERLADQYPLTEALGVLGLFAMILSVFWVRSYRKTRSIRDALLSPSALVSLGCFLIALSLFGIEKYAEWNPPAFTLEATAIKSAPAQHNLEVARVIAGTKVRVLDQFTDAEGKPWVKIRFNREQLGWVPSATLLLFTNH